MPVIPVIPVGPGDTERQRLRRVVGSLFRHEPGLIDYVVVTDGIDPRVTAEDLAGLGPRPLTVQNPRRGRGVASFDGLICGLTAAYGFVADRFPGAHVWKIDTDAYVIGPCRTRIAAKLDAEPATGMVGTVDVDCDGLPRDDAFRRLADVHRKYLWPAWWWQSTGRLTTPLVGRGRRFASWYRQYDAAGARRGRYVQGGSYAVNATLLATWQSRRTLGEPEAWPGAPFGEDLAFSMAAVIAGFSLGNFNAAGEVFGVKNAGLCLPPAELIARGYGVVHSVKAAAWDDELATIATIDAAPSTL